MNKCGVAALVFVVVSSGTHLHAASQVPGLISYQGRMASNGTNFSGPGQFKFAFVSGGTDVSEQATASPTINGSGQITAITVVNAGAGYTSRPSVTITDKSGSGATATAVIDHGTVVSITVGRGGSGYSAQTVVTISPPPPSLIYETYWSHDRTSDQGGEPDTFVSLPVNDGLFSVMLGDSNLLHMTAIPLAAFTYPDVHLRVWFSGGESGFTLLRPDQRVGAAGYALRSASVPDGSITLQQLAPEVLQAALIADGSVTTAKLADGAVTSDKVAPTLALSQLSIVNFFNDVVRMDLNGLTGALTAYGASELPDVILSSGNYGKLELYDGPGNHLTAELSATLSSGGLLRLSDGEGSQRAHLFGDAPAVLFGTATGAGGLDLEDASGSERIRLRAGDSTIHLTQGNGNAGVYLSGQGFSGGGFLRLHQSDNDLGVTLSGQGSAGAGEIGLYDTAETRRVTLQGPDGILRLSDENGGATMELRGDNGDLVALTRIGVAATVNAGVHLASLGRDSHGGLVRTRDENNNTTTLMGSNPAGGFVHAYQGNGLAGVSMMGNLGPGGAVEIRDANGTPTIQLLGAQDATSGSRIEMRQDNNALTVILDGEVGNGGGGYLQLRQGDETPTITLDANAAGEGKITTQVLQITGGSDLSEQFEVRAEPGPVEPGMIVCIDPDHPGQLVVSSTPYDGTVAGVISGAGGVKPGMLMGQTGSIADGRHPVALTGRVYCLVDADLGAIRAGDLITTSSTPGHGMKAGDPTRAHGAILGKAMTSLDEGKGLVLLLVSLH